MRGNHSPFLNKTLSKVVMLRTKMRNIFLKNRSEESKDNYRKQQNICVQLLRKSKRDYYGKLNEHNICDNKKFWKVVKPCLSNKVVSSEKITLIEGDKIIKNDRATVKVFNDFFSNIIKNLNIPQFNPGDPICGKIIDP